VETLIDPKLGFEALEIDNIRSIPKVASLKLIKECGKVLSGVSDSLGSYPYSQESLRKEIYSDYEVEFCNVIANTAYTLSKILSRDWEENLEKEAMNLISPTSKEDLESVKKSQLIGFLESVITEDHSLDIGELVDSIEKNKKFYYRQLD